MTHSTNRFLFRSQLFSLLTGVLLQATTALAAPPPGVPGGRDIRVPGPGGCEPGVRAAIDFRAGNPSKTARREHIAVSSALLAQLGFNQSDIDSDGHESPQVRVVVSNPQIEGWTSSANFTIDEVFVDPQLRVEVYPRPASQNPSEYRHSGEFKLFAEDNVNLGQVTVSVFPFGPFASFISGANGSQTIGNFCKPEPAVNHFFAERAHFEDQNEFLLAIPHGGKIELGTSDQREPVLEALALDYSIFGDSWENLGYWGNNQTFVRWHITSSAFFEPSFPGLEMLMSQNNDYMNGVPYRYSAALHGFSGSSEMLLIGGNANRDEKCYVADRILAQMGGNGSDVMMYIFGDANNPAGVSVPNDQDEEIDPNDYSHLKGSYSKNVVNRFSPNLNSQGGWGAFQLEQSTALRNDPVLLEAVALGLAEAVGELILQGGVPFGFSCNSL